ncbi:energy-coupling factor transporter ATPase [Paenibacillus sp. KACC 21273]|uniref:energy-coupling factor transporter ATPase n=1 Tax=Paenibacillus sp. KACC 21273 TaxID=3025665 RepID=UPI0023662C62|nr:energy-coupling factor transporter ATPase [Paenibacillus sp. KACC 21273]WDF50420.1 energy-coupling factor transporter ATPase [Paenibacillus sp. KACC 21273]
MLRLNHVHFYYKKGRPVLDDISLTIQQGEFVAIVGANGCGKSTIAKLIDGLVVPKQGTVHWNEWDTSKPDELAEIRQQIGYIFQNPEDQFITTTVMDEVLFGLENIALPRAEMQPRVQEALQAVQMESYIDAQPHQLSGGQKQRVAIAAILAMRPQMIIFDEATSMLDPQGREQILAIMHQLHQQGITIIHITHHMDEVLTAQRVLLIDQGRLVFDGAPVSFFDEIPVNDYQLQLPFAVQVHRQLQLTTPVATDWKEAIRRQWSINSNT